MSRSYRHNPVLQTCSRTQKEWRREYNRCLRHRNKILLHVGEEDFLRVRDVSDIWTSPSDGWLTYWHEWSERRKKYIWCGYDCSNTPEEADALRRCVYNK